MKPEASIVAAFLAFDLICVRFCTGKGFTTKFRDRIFALIKWKIDQNDTSLKFVVLLIQFLRRFLRR